MSIHVPASRRNFLKTTIGAGIVVLSAHQFSQKVSADDQAKIDPDSWIFFSDTHIASDKTKIVFETNMFANLSRSIDEVLALPKRPAGLFVNGDCAYLKGLPEDYTVFASEIKRLTLAGINVHITMGNHDDRKPFLDAIDNTTRDGTDSPLEGKIVSIVQGEKVNWFLVDTLQIVNEVTGEVGAMQRKWLAMALDKHADKPAIVIGHHNPQYLPEGSTEKVSGLVDTAELVDVFHAHPQVKAYIYGHTHNWSRKQTAGKVHLINLPPIAYLFDKERPNGWVHATVTEEGITLKLAAIDKKHKEHEKEIVLAYR